MTLYRSEQAEWKRRNLWVEGNVFRKMNYVEKPLPKFEEEKVLLPEPIIGTRSIWKKMYYRVWEIAFKNFRRPEKESGFICNFIDTAFSDDTFMWDSCFMTMFGRYCHQIFPVVKTLDNFYAKQHNSGFICRVINTFDGQDYFPEFDPDSTGPNIFSWIEWNHYLHFGDKDRLAMVFPVLMAFHQWFREFRSWPNGLYWATGFSSGMDQQTRVPDSMNYHRHYTWVDTCMQVALDSQCLYRIALETDKGDIAKELKKEYASISKLVNKYLWDKKTGFYYDLAPDGKLSSIKTVGAYWALLAGLVPEERKEIFLSHFCDEKSFKTCHSIPSQSVDSEGYPPPYYNVPYGYGWIGGVWPPTNYMVIKGLRNSGEHQIAHKIALNHIENVSKVFEKTGTVWEYYDPKISAPGILARKDFVGWSGLGPIAILIEDIIGINGNWKKNEIEWDIRLMEKHGVIRYPFGPKDTISLLCRARNNEGDRPFLQIDTPVKFMLRARWNSNEKLINVSIGKKEYTL